MYCSGYALDEANQLSFHRCNNTFASFTLGYPHFHGARKIMEAIMKKSNTCQSKLNSGYHIFISTVVDLINRPGRLSQPGFIAQTLRPTGPLS